MSTKIRLVESTEPKIRLAPSTEPPIDATDVARALGAEPVGPAGPEAGFTFAAIRARVAALIADRGRRTGPAFPLHIFNPTVRESVAEITAALHADGALATPSEVAEVLMEMSIEVAKKDRSLLIQKLRERAARAGGQPS